MLLIFGNEHDASICLKSLFPDPAELEAEKMRIRIQVMPLANIDWNFQSSFDGFINFPAKPIEYYVPIQTRSSAKILKRNPIAKKRRIEILEIDLPNEDVTSKWKRITYLEHT